jgi:hypothetical protein
LFLPNRAFFAFFTRNQGFLGISFGVLKNADAQASAPKKGFNARFAPINGITGLKAQCLMAIKAQVEGNIRLGQWLVRCG